MNENEETTVSQSELRDAALTSLQPFRRPLRSGRKSCPVCVGGVSLGMWKATCTIETTSSLFFTYHVPVAQTPWTSITGGKVAPRLPGHRRTWIGPTLEGIKLERPRVVNLRKSTRDSSITLYASVP